MERQQGKYREKEGRTWLKKWKESGGGKRRDHTSFESRRGCQLTLYSNG